MGFQTSPMDRVTPRQVTPGGQSLTGLVLWLNTNWAVELEHKVRVCKSKLWAEGDWRREGKDSGSSW